MHTPLFLSVLLCIQDGIIHDDSVQVLVRDARVQYLRVSCSWYEWWTKCGFFEPDVKSDKPPYVIVSSFPLLLLRLFFPLLFPFSCVVIFLDLILSSNSINDVFTH
jgi:hypothetical protein